METLTISFQPGIFTLLSYDLLSLVDTGECISVEECLQMCEDYTIMSWLKDNVEMFNLWDDEIKIILAEEFAALANVVVPDDDYGIVNNGILVLIAFCQELINAKPTRDRKDCETAENELSKLGLIKKI